MRWEDLPWYDKLGEVMAALCVFALPFLIMFILEALGYGDRIP